MYSASKIFNLGSILQHFPHFDDSSVSDLTVKPNRSEKRQIKINQTQIHKKQTGNARHSNSNIAFPHYKNRRARGPRGFYTHKINNQNIVTNQSPTRFDFLYRISSHQSRTIRVMLHGVRYNGIGSLLIATRFITAFRSR